MKSFKTIYLCFIQAKFEMLQASYMIKKIEPLNDEFTFDVLCKMSDLVINGKDALVSNSLKDFGLLLDETWKLKNLLSKSVSSYAFGTTCTMKEFQQAHWEEKF